MNEEHMNLHGSYRWIVKLEKCSAQISMFFNPNEYSAPMTIKKNKILGTAGYQQDSTANLAHLPWKGP